MKKRVLVTGCTGLVGHGICLHFLNHGYEVWGTARKNLSSTHPGFTTVQLELSDITEDTDRLASLPSFDAVIHTAAKLPQGPAEHDGFQEYSTLNVDATRALIQAMAEKADCFTYISGTGLLNPTRMDMDEDAPFLPANEYLYSKAAGELATTLTGSQTGMRTIILRFPAPYGYRGRASGVLPRFIQQARADQPITLWGSGKRQQLFTFVDDIGQACRLAQENGAQGTYHITGPEVVTMKTLAETVINSIDGTKSEIVFSGQPDPQEGKMVSISTRKAREEFGFTPTHSLEMGIKKVITPSSKTTFFTE